MVAHLQQAASEGRLDLDELGERIAGAYASRTWQELAGVVDDLPAPMVDEPAAPPGGVSTGGWLRPILVAAVGGLAVPVTFASPAGALLGIVAAALGVFTLSTAEGLSLVQRLLLLGGVVLGLIPAVFFVVLLVTLGT